MHLYPILGTGVGRFAKNPRTSLTGAIKRKLRQLFFERSKIVTEQMGNVVWESDVVRSHTRQISHGLVATSTWRNAQRPDMSLGTHTRERAMDYLLLGSVQ